MQYHTSSVVVVYPMDFRVATLSIDSGRSLVWSREELKLLYFSEVAELDELDPLYKLDD